MCDDIGQVAQGETGHIEDHIVNIKAAQQAQQLGQFDDKDGSQSRSKELEKVPVPPPNAGDQPACRDKHHHIAHQVDKTMDVHFIVGVLGDYLPIVLDGVQGLKIHILPENILISHAFLPATGAAE